LLVLVLGITVLFLVMIRRFLVSALLAGVFAAMGRSVFLNLERRLGGRSRIAAMILVLALLLLIAVPVAGFGALVASQAVEMADMAGPWIERQVSRWPELSQWMRSLPLVGAIVPDGQALVNRAGDLASSMGSYLVNTLGAATTGTANLVLQLFVLHYALDFFLLDGPRILSRILYLSPLRPEAESRLMERFVSVTRATIKGSLLVGLIQGALAGAAFFVLGLPGAAFWSAVMAVLSVVPVIGSVIVWGPAAVILIATGQVAKGIALAIWGTVVVSTVDNFLRPRFVGRDSQMHDLLVLLSTFGGLALFGLVGFIVGPVVAALFVTAWDLYGVAFAEMLPENDPAAPASTDH